MNAIFWHLYFSLTSSFNMFADQINLFLSPSFIKWKNACVTGFALHSICIFEVHSYFINHFFQELRNFWLGRFTVKSCYHCFSLILTDMFFILIFSTDFVFFIHVKDSSFHIRNLSLNCFISSISSWISLPSTDLQKLFQHLISFSSEVVYSFVGLFWVASYFSSVFLEQLSIFFVSSFGFVIFPSFPSSNFLFFLPVFFCFMCPFVHSFPFLPTVSETFQALLLLQCCFPLSFSFHSSFFLRTKYVMSRGIDDLLSTSSYMTAAVIFPSHFILIVFPLIVFT